ncbi:lysozyme-like domain-containing protein [Dimargaris cristalligena]|uniref:Lysozyme-like domain-containing protein n=1 Tax=Dimargaris cristalligena TaxID=215637 RepID=A0A4P9ZVP7_9FUNG|nr:lysozyme-like domain-containing protein [Dimargaris cristalligena]|eukprot:RKP36710.1 lysozyme-like domain-containing protein [Dimargaris cristalligena]
MAALTIMARPTPDTPVKPSGLESFGILSDPSSKLERGSDESNNVETRVWATTLSQYKPDNRTAMMDCQLFYQAVMVGGFPRPTPGQCDDFREYATTEGGIVRPREAAMFLTQVLWESNGLRSKEEHVCAGNQCPGNYTTDNDFSYTEKQGDQTRTVVNQYYGRGYIQLTWSYNYLAASKSMYGDDRLYKNPQLVASDEMTAWRTSFWFWKQHVHDIKEVQDGQFGASTRAINGGLECDGPYQDKARLRFELYTKILKIVEPDTTPDPAGCYSVDSNTNTNTNTNGTSNSNSNS